MDVDDVSALLAGVAEQVIMPRFGALAAGDITEKGPGDLVTVADREAEAAITRVLRAAFPGSLVVGEESAYADRRALDALPSAEHAWVIDPVDGTRNFAHGRPDFAVMLAELRSGETVRGWILQPVHERLYLGELGGGVTCNGVAIQRRPDQRSRPVGATYARVPSGAESRLSVVRPWGSCGIDYPKLLEGVVDFLAYRSLHPWDHLPGGLMVRETGGRVANDDGVDFRPGVVGRRLLAAASPGLWDTARDALLGAS